MKKVVFYRDGSVLFYEDNELVRILIQPTVKYLETLITEHTIIWKEFDWKEAYYETLAL